MNSGGFKMKSKWKTASEQTAQNKRRNERRRNEAKKRQAIAELGKALPSYRRKPVITRREHKIVEHMLADGIFEIPSNMRRRSREAIQKSYGRLLKLLGDEVAKRLEK
jgi:hypothetical protein